MRVERTAYTNRPSKRGSRLSTARHASSASRVGVGGSARKVVGMVNMIDAPWRTRLQAYARAAQELSAPCGQTRALLWRRAMRPGSDVNLEAGCESSIT